MQYNESVALTIMAFTGIGVRSKEIRLRKVAGAPETVHALEVKSGVEPLGTIAKSVLINAHFPSAGPGLKINVGVWGKPARVNERKSSAESRIRFKVQILSFKDTKKLF